MALALVRDPRDHRVPANEEDLADFETDVGAPVQICRIADSGESEPLARPTSCWPGAAESRPGAASTSTSASDRRWLLADQSHWAGMKVGLGVTSIDSITLGDGEGRGERAPSRRSVRRRR